MTELSERPAAPPRYSRRPPTLVPIPAYDRETSSGFTPDGDHEVFTWFWEISHTLDSDAEDFLSDAIRNSMYLFAHAAAEVEELIESGASPEDMLSELAKVFSCVNGGASSLLTHIVASIGLGPAGVESGRAAMRQLKIEGPHLGAVARNDRNEYYAGPVSQILADRRAAWEAAVR